jgi:hypothetical protein
MMKRKGLENRQFPAPWGLQALVDCAGEIIKFSTSKMFNSEPNYFSSKYAYSKNQGFAHKEGNRFRIVLARCNLSKGFFCSLQNGIAPLWDHHPGL